MMPSLRFAALWLALALLTVAVWVLVATRLRRGGRG